MPCRLCSLKFCSSACLNNHSKTHKKKKVARRRRFSFFSCFCKNSEVQSDSEEQKQTVMKSAQIALSNATTISTNSTSPSNSFFSGLRGLQNLGNTCFMNSAIQCLAHSEDLSKLFLTGDYVTKINKSNPLGTKGKIASAYGELLNHMWNGKEKSVAPWGLKKTIAAVASQFEGYQQHDSHEFLSYLISGLHEDLNEITKKPYYDTDIKFSNDAEVAEESWRRHISRNKSIIVDLMYGQYKSTLHCPKCKKYSYAFDPFNCISLPIPQSIKKRLDILYFPYNLGKDILQIYCPYDPDNTILDVKKYISNSLSIPITDLKCFETTTTGTIKLLSDERDEINKIQKISVYNIPKDAQDYLLLYITTENLINPSYPRVLGYNKQKPLPELLNDIYQHLKMFFIMFKLDMQQFTPDEVYSIFSYSTKFIKCFICNKADCRTCEVKSNDKITQNTIQNTNMLSIKIVINK